MNARSEKHGSIVLAVIACFAVLGIPATARAAASGWGAPGSSFNAGRPYDASRTGGGSGHGGGFHFGFGHHSVHHSSSHQEPARDRNANANQAGLQNGARAPGQPRFIINGRIREWAIRNGVTRNPADMRQPRFAVNATIREHLRSKREPKFVIAGRLRVVKANAGEAIRSAARRVFRGRESTAQ